MKAAKPLIYITILALIIGSVAYTKYKAPVSDDISKPSYYTVTKGDLMVSVTEEGVLKAVDEQTIENQLSGNSIILSIVPEGSRVKKGELLVELDPSDTLEKLQKIQLELETNKSSVITAKNDLLIEKSTIESDQREAKNQIEFASMDLRKFEELDKNQQIREASSKITSDEESLRLTEEKYNWSEKLAAKGFETKSQVEKDKLELNNKQTTLESAKSRLTMLKKFDLPKMQVELTAKVTEANNKYQRILKQGESKLSRAQGKLAAAERTLQLTETKLADTEEQLRNTKLYAPTDGIVIYPSKSSYNYQQSSIEVGSEIKKKREIISIPNLDKMKVVVKIPEFQISKLKLGQQAYVTIDSVSDQRYKAEVSQVSPIPEKTRSWLGGEKKYKTELIITDQLPDVKPSISAKAEIVINDLTDVLYVPLHAIRTIDGKYYCYIKNGEQHDKKEITLGLSNNSFAEITSGIAINDQILLNAPEESQESL